MVRFTVARRVVLPGPSNSGAPSLFCGVPSKVVDLVKSRVSSEISAQGALRFLAGSLQNTVPIRSEEELTGTNVFTVANGSRRRFLKHLGKISVTFCSCRSRDSVVRDLIRSGSH